MATQDLVVQRLKPRGLKMKTGAPAQACECVTLLIAAHDQATIASHGGELSDDTHFSQPVSAILFIGQLFSSDFAAEYLESHPDNVSSSVQSPSAATTLREALKNAVVNFTHFIKWGDESSFNPEAALHAYLRSAAIICRNNAKAVDVIIPIVLDHRERLTPSNMTCMFVQFKNGQMAESRAKTSIFAQDLSYFPRNVDESRIYLAVVMELGLARPSSWLAKVCTQDQSLLAQKLHQAVPKPSDLLAPTRSPRSGIYIPPLLTYGSAATQNPRYSIFVYGCSSTVYQVIEQDEDHEYKSLLAIGDLFAEHSRQSAEALGLLRRQKLLMIRGPDCFHWSDSAWFNDPFVTDPADAADEFNNGRGSSADEDAMEGGMSGETASFSHSGPTT
jgi:hypothetical protein